MKYEDSASIVLLAAPVVVPAVGAHAAGAVRRRIAWSAAILVARVGAIFKAFAVGTGRSAGVQRTRSDDWGPFPWLFNCVVFGIAVFAAPAFAQEYPAQPVRVIVGFSPGSATDIAARLIAERLSERMKITFFVDNRPSAGSLVAIQALKKSQADGYTLMITTASALVQNPGIQRDLPYDPVLDFAHVAQVFKMHGVLVVNPTLPAHNVAELIEIAKKSPGKLNYGSSGIGMANHLEMELLMSRTGTEMVHVPYKGDNQVASEIAAGRLDVAIETLTTAMPLVRAGKQRALAVLSMHPVTGAEGVPNLAEIGIPGLEGLEPFTFVGLVAPAGLPIDRLRMLNGAVNEILKQPELVSRLGQMGLEPFPDSPEGFRQLLDRELKKWREIGTRLTIK